MFTDFMEKTVVIDTSTPIIYLGKLKEIAQDHLVLTDVDIHDSSEYSSTKEQYLAKTTVTGIRPNRKNAFIDKNKVVSISLFSDIINT